MRTERRRIERGEHGPVSAVIAYPDGWRRGAAAAVILAHGAGNDMSQPLLSGVHEGLAARGFVCVKFNIPKRLGRSQAAVIEEVVAVSTAWLRQLLGQGPVPRRQRREDSDGR